MRARRHQLSFDRLDTRLVLDGGTAAIAGGGIGITLAPQVGSTVVVDNMIPDPGLLGGGDNSGSGGSMIPDPGLLN